CSAMCRKPCDACRLSQARPRSRAGWSQPHHRGRLTTYYQSTPTEVSLERLPNRLTATRRTQPKKSFSDVRLGKGIGAPLQRKVGRINFFDGVRRGALARANG